MINKEPNNSNNILSYFIKDIKDYSELLLYKQININNNIYILYKGEILYKMEYFSINQPLI